MIHRLSAIVVLAVLAGCGGDDTAQLPGGSTQAKGTPSDRWGCSGRVTGHWYDCSLQFGCPGIGAIELDCKLDGGISLCECRENGVVKTTFLSREICLSLAGIDPNDPSQVPAHDKPRYTLLNSHCGWKL